jgi:8-oxo-dGTP diphosphatase
MRNTIYEIISQIKPHDDLEKNHISETLSWIKNAEQIFRVQKPDVPKKHLVCNFVLFDALHRKILMTDHKKSLQWRPTGGHMELDEEPTETVKRECMEELRVQADFLWPDPIFLNVKISEDHGINHIDVGLWYVLRGDSNATYQFDQEELNDIFWLRFDEIPYEKSDMHMSRFVDKFKSYIQLL